MADPDGKVVVDPTAGKEPRQAFARRMLLQEVSDLDGTDRAAAYTVLVQGAQEGDTASRIVLPAVFAVEDNVDQGWLGAGHSLADLL